VAKLMAETLVEEKTADTKLNELATSGINQQALDAA
jgi:ferritin-like metal-binding protein YciE